MKPTIKPKNPNFSWVLLDRVLFYYEHLITRAHGRRDALIIDLSKLDGKEEKGQCGYSSMFASGRRKKLDAWLRQLEPGKGQVPVEEEREAWEEICRILAEIEEGQLRMMENNSVKAEI